MKKSFENVPFHFAKRSVIATKEYIHNSKEEENMVDQEESSQRENQNNLPSPEMPDGSKEEELTFASAAGKTKQILITDEELKNLHKELLDYKDKYLRLLADSENARKRLQKERQDMTRYAVESLVVDFLRPLDNFENALRFAQDMTDEVKNWAFGFQMILAQFKDVLAQNGITPIESLGKTFDPNDHEALEMVESDQEPGTIMEECVKGYKMGDRTIRAARVKVAKAQSKPAPTEENQANENN